MVRTKPILMLRRMKHRLKAKKVRRRKLNQLLTESLLLSQSPLPTKLKIRLSQMKHLQLNQQRILSPRVKLKRR